MVVHVYRSSSLMKVEMRNAVCNMAAWSNLQGAPRKAEILWEVHTIWQDIMWCQQCTSTWVQFRHQVPGQHSGPYTYFKQIQCYQYPTRNFKNATVKYGLTHQSLFCEMALYDVMSCSMADVYRCFVRWPIVMWYHVVWLMCTDILRCHAVWQMCINVLWDGPLWCDM
jgi:hypothetical protein